MLSDETCDPQVVVGLDEVDGAEPKVPGLALCVGVLGFGVALSERDREPPAAPALRLIVYDVGDDACGVPARLRTISSQIPNASRGGFDRGRGLQETHYAWEPVPRVRRDANSLYSERDSIPSLDRGVREPDGRTV